MNISEKNFCLFNFAMQIAKSVLWKYHTRIIKKNTNNLYSYQNNQRDYFFIITIGMMERILAWFITFRMNSLKKDKSKSIRAKLF